jgi:molybdopterin-guanine dinucleotide biosynthesis protein A
VLWTAAIVAGGAASRFGGRDKSLLPVGNRSILGRQLAVLRPLTDRILVVANNPERFSHLAVPAVRDLVPGAAALGGIYTALSAATTNAVLVVACDLPFLTGRFLEHLVQAADGFDLTIPRSADGPQPMCAMYSRACLEPIRTRIAAATLRVQDLAAEVRTREIGPPEIDAYDPDGLLFFNVNTPADYQRALEIAARHEDRITHVPLRRQQDR